MLACAVLLTVSGSVASAAEAQLVFLVRHAEKAISVPVPGAAAGAMTAASDDPPLSVSGHERAARLAAMLRSANIRNIFTSEFVRTRQTAAPIAQVRHLEIVAIPAKDLDALLEGIRQAKGNVLVVGHSNSVPDVLKRLGIKDDVTIADSEYDNLFIVVRPETGGPSLIRLRY
jgi:phosphohistidine phosphatase SixA